MTKKENYKLLIAEKPAAAFKIADALADGKVEKKEKDGVPFYKIRHNNEEIIVACAVGHLFNLAEKTKNGLNYPTFLVEWRPSYLINKKSAFSKKYFDVLKELVKNAKNFYNFCDVDVEGELIFRNILRFIAKKEDAKRAYFSTLTKDELKNAYENVKPHIDFSMAESGETRHNLDFVWGINLSRALMSSIKKAGSFKIMSIGRVQGPALKIIVDREKEIQAFNPVPFWQLELKGKIKNENVVAWHKEDKFWEKEKAESILSKTKNKKAAIKKIESKEFTQTPPHPFDLTTLQIEAYRCFGISPKETLAIAQDLYTSGLISYPRTSSQIISNSIDYIKILKELQKQSEYKELAKELLLRKNLVPNNGKKSDPAHPAIYVTGEISKLDARKKKIYDLIARRFLATFAEPAKRLTVTWTIDVNDEDFIARGITTKEKGWHKFYGPYAKFKEEELPPAKEEDELKNPLTAIHEDATKPPKRYTPASLIKELESKNLGTKATRSSIIDSLYQRNYVQEKAIEATQLGMKTIETLEKYVPEIIDEKLTRHFEEDMELIQEEKKDGKDVIDEAKVELTKILKDFKKKEEGIGKELLEATRETQRIASTIGKCFECKEGDLIARRGKFGLFIACNKYPACKTTFSIPSHSSIKPTDELCPECKYYLILVFRKGKRPFKYCINKKCPKKLEWIKQHQEKNNQNNKIEVKQ